MKVFCVKQRVYDKGRQEIYTWEKICEKLPENCSVSNFKYIDYYSYFYTPEAARNYINDQKVA